MDSYNPGACMDSYYKTDRAFEVTAEAVEGIYALNPIA